MFWSCWKTHLAYLKTWSPHIPLQTSEDTSHSAGAFSHIAPPFWLRLEASRRNVRMYDPQPVAGVGKLTAVINPKPAHVPSSCYTGISTPRISAEQKETSGPRSHRWVEGESPGTSRSLKRALTSDTSHRFSIRHNDPNRPGIVNRYDLNRHCVDSR